MGERQRHASSHLALGFFLVGIVLAMGGLLYLNKTLQKDRAVAAKAHQTNVKLAAVPGLTGEDAVASLSSETLQKAARQQAPTTSPTPKQHGQGELTTTAIGHRLLPNGKVEVSFQIQGPKSRAAQGIVWGFARFTDPSGAWHDVPSHRGLDPARPLVNTTENGGVSFKVRSHVKKTLVFSPPAGFANDWRLDSASFVVREKGREPLAANLPVHPLKDAARH